MLDEVVSLIYQSSIHLRDIHHIHFRLDVRRYVCLSLPLGYISMPPCLDDEIACSKCNKVLGLDVGSIMYIVGSIPLILDLNS